MAGPGTVAGGIEEEEKAQGAVAVDTRVRPRPSPLPPPFRLDEGVLDVEFERRLRSPLCPEDEDEEDEDKEEEMEAEEDMQVFSSPPVWVLKAIEPEEEALCMLFCRLPLPLCEREEGPLPPPPPPAPLRTFACS